MKKKGCGDNGFATFGLYDLREAKADHYVIQLKNNRKLGQIAEKLMLYGNN
ncbi:hypothetical protein J7E16_08285 [Carnobacterium sp. ISL-102]|nr:hypothetical protein [Carnobacterium sp. ISL-102]